MTIEHLTKAELIRRYCETQDSTPEKLESTLESLIQRYQPVGFMLLRCIVLDSSRLGQRVIVPYGPRNSLKHVPDSPFSPRGLASDISEVEGVWEV